MHMLHAGSVLTLYLVHVDFIVDIGTLEQIHYTSEDLFITHIPFNESLEVFGVSSSVTLNEPSFSRSFSISNEPMCALLFIDETGSVILTTNDVRYGVCVHVIATARA